MIGTRTASADRKTSLNQALREFRGAGVSDDLLAESRERRGCSGPSDGGRSPSAGSPAPVGHEGLLADAVARWAGHVCTPRRSCGSATRSSSAVREDARPAVALVGHLGYRAHWPEDPPPALEGTAAWPGQLGHEGRGWR